MVFDSDTETLTPIRARPTCLLECVGPTGNNHSEGRESDRHQQQRVRLSSSDGEQKPEVVEWGKRFSPRTVHESPGGEGSLLVLEIALAILQLKC